ncbi:Rex2p [Sporobolomyces koalae]|uniref:Rex2p n=1 Tax=Sporobolomyces koalae TaxID=500713 RepID=UPI00318252F6
MAQSRNADNILWIDCEMTGLNPYLPREGLREGQAFVPDRILEIACIATNANLEPLDDGVEYIVNTDRDVLDSMNDWCIKQHAKTGLTQACLDSKYTMEQVDSLVAAYVAKHWPPSTPALLAGNSVHADRAFINKDLPLLAAKLHYRILDVSSIKELARRWYPTAVANSKLKRKEEAEHRALSDIQASIAELKFYREHLFQPVEQKQ